MKKTAIYSVSHNATTFKPFQWIIQERADLKELIVISGKGGTGKTGLLCDFASLAKDRILYDAEVDAAARKMPENYLLRRVGNYLYQRPAVARWHMPVWALLRIILEGL